MLPENSLERLIEKPIEVFSVVERLIKLLSVYRARFKYLGPTNIALGGNMEEHGVIEISEEIGVDYYYNHPEPLDIEGFLDSSSRSIDFIGPRLFFSTLYAKDLYRDILIPVNMETKFIALKLGVDAYSKILESGEYGGEALRYVYLENPVGEPYVEDYKDDNISDELRLRIENYVISRMRSSVILIDGPIYPPLAVLGMMGDRYRRAIMHLYNERKGHIERLVGVVKRLESTWKLSRVDEISRGLRAPDPIVVQELARGRDLFVTPILREDLLGLGYRYMIYIYKRTPTGSSVFRLEASSKEKLVRAAARCIKNLSLRGIPEEIEIADRISRRLSSSLYIVAYTIGSTLLGVAYDETNKLVGAMADVGSIGWGEQY